MYGMDQQSRMRGNGQSYSMAMMPNNYGPGTTMTGYGPQQGGYSRIGQQAQMMPRNHPQQLQHPQPLQRQQSGRGFERQVSQRNLQGGGRGPGPQAQYSLARNGSFFGAPMQPAGSFMMGHPQGSMGNLQGSFRRTGSFSYGNTSLYNLNRSGSAFGSIGARGLPRINSGVNFDYYNNNASQTSFTGSNPYGSMSQIPSFYRYNSFGNNHNGNGSTMSTGSANHAGLTGIGPGLSMTSVGSMIDQSTTSPATSSRNAPSNGSRNSTANNNNGPLSRQDSATSLQRQFSVAGDLYKYNNSNNMSSNGGGAATSPQSSAHRQPGWMANPNQQRFYPNSGQGAGAPPSRVLTVNGGGPLVQPRGMPNVPGQMMHQVPMQQRLAGGDADRQKDEDVVVEGEPQALGRANSSSNLSRKNSEKRVGKYFSHKEATDGEYKKDGDPSVGKKGATKDPTLTNNVKAILMLDNMSGSERNTDVDVDGRTVRAMKPGAEEVQKYDLREVIYINRTTDVSVNSESIEEIRDNFVYGCNVGMIMADADCRASDPASWFSWLTLKSVVRGTFAKLDGKGEISVSMCLLQDDQVLDLLADSPRGFMTLAVAESPLFGNVANNLMYMSMDDAGEFNDTLDAALERARGRGSGGEYGIVLVTCVLKQVRRSSSSGKEDVIVSSIFASGVGDGVIHYNRILDKNPAEPRALFYSVLHRSVHSCAIFSCADTNPNVLTYLSTLQRFSKVETRRPKVGSVRTFVNFSKSTAPKIREDAKKMNEGRQKAMTLRYLEKLELMLSDAEDMLRNPTESLPKTYM